MTFEKSELKGIVKAILVIAFCGLLGWSYGQYRAGQDVHQKTEILFNALVGYAANGTLTVTEQSGTKRPATRLDILISLAEQAAAQAAKQQAEQPVTPGAK